MAEQAKSMSATSSSLKRTGTRLGLLDTLIVFFAAFAIAFVIFWAGGQIAGKTLFGSLPGWVTSGTNAIWIFATGVGLSTFLLFLRKGLQGEVERPNYLWLISGVVVAIVVLVLGIAWMVRDELERDDRIIQLDDPPSPRRRDFSCEYNLSGGRDATHDFRLASSTIRAESITLMFQTTNSRSDGSFDQPDTATLQLRPLEPKSGGGSAKLQLKLDGRTKSPKFFARIVNSAKLVLRVKDKNGDEFDEVLAEFLGPNNPKDCEFEQFNFAATVSFRSR